MRFCSCCSVCDHFLESLFYSLKKFLENSCDLQHCHSIRAPIQVSAASLVTQLTDTKSETAEEVDPSPWAPVPMWETQKKAPGFWILSGTIPSAVWGENQWAEGPFISLCLCFCNPVFQIQKINVKKIKQKKVTIDMFRNLEVQK